MKSAQEDMKSAQKTENIGQLEGGSMWRRFFISAALAAGVSIGVYAFKTEENEKIACQQMAKGEPVKNGDYWSMYLAAEGPRADLIESKGHSPLDTFFRTPFDEVEPEDALFVADACNKRLSTEPLRVRGADGCLRYLMPEIKVTVDDVRRAIEEVSE